ncbi:MAG: response regulator transcription factor [Bacteroidota bacterium]
MIPLEKCIKIIIVEDHVIFREGIKKVLAEISGVEVIAEAENGEQFLAFLEKGKPDIVLMDLKMPVMDGMEATERALKLYPDLKIIVLTMFGDEEYLYSMVLKGIYGYLLKTTSLTNLERAIRMVSNGQQYYTPELNGMLAKKLRQFSTNEIPTFSGKENELLKLLCKGLSTEEMAEKLCMSKRTIEGYRAKLLQKTGLSNTINLVIYAIRNKLVNLEEMETGK